MLCCCETKGMDDSQWQDDEEPVKEDETHTMFSSHLKAAPVEEKAKGRKENPLLRKRVMHMLAEAEGGKRGLDQLPDRIASLVSEIRNGSEEEPEERAFGLASGDFGDLRSLGIAGVGGGAKVEVVELPSKELRALKCHGKLHVAQSGMVDNLMMERAILATTSAYPSPFIISYYGCCQTPSQVIYQLEHGIGGELYSVYKKQNLFGSLEHCRYYIACACAAILHLHKLSIMLRSLKPEDCVLTAEGRLKLVDFDLSKLIVNKTYTTCGTPDYFAPEIIISHGHDFLVDWWSVGVMTFELLAGDPPFNGPTPMDIYSKVRAGIECVTFPESVAPAEKFIRKLCAHTPANRVLKDVSKHSFFASLGSFEGLEFRVPPHQPSLENGPLANCSSAVKPEDLPAWCSSKGEVPVLPAWELFGPQYPSDDIPDKK